MQQSRDMLAGLSGHVGAGEPVKLSVIIPCLNAERTIGEQLAALAGQRWPERWEVIVADNGSTDGTLAVVRSFADRLPGLRVVDAS
ncbi:MAG: glycosyltransferase, partial [Gammaproteobacteria bacterium]